MNTEDLKIEAGYPKGKGGQTAGMPTPIVCVTHIPTGLSATCGFERSQLKNKKICLAMLEYGLAELGWKEAK